MVVYCWIWDLLYSYSICLVLMQTLGIGHAFSSFIWLCGPITGLVVGFLFIFHFNSHYILDLKFIFILTILVYMIKPSIFYGLVSI